jgi:hypothetical protein
VIQRFSDSAKRPFTSDRHSFQLNSKPAPFNAHGPTGVTLSRYPALLPLVRGCHSLASKDPEIQSRRLASGSLHRNSILYLLAFGSFPPDSPRFLFARHGANISIILSHFFLIAILCSSFPSPSPRPIAIGVDEDPSGKGRRPIVHSLRLHESLKRSFAVDSCSPPTPPGHSLLQEGRVGLNQRQVFGSGRT